MAELAKSGFAYTNENGESEVIPRAQVGLEEYNYSKEQHETKRALMVKCIDQYPTLDKSTLNILVDYYLNHADKLEAECMEDKDYAGYVGLN